jgi:hypothetical protein
LRQGVRLLPRTDQILTSGSINGALGSLFFENSPGL